VPIGGNLAIFFQGRKNAMPRRRHFLTGIGATLLFVCAPGLSIGAARLRMRATSLTKQSHWGIYVQEVAVRNNLIVPLSLIGCFEFGRKQDPAVYAEIMSAPLPIIASATEPYRVAVYFFENRDISLQPHSDIALLANRLHSEIDDQGRTVRLMASYWDNADNPNANIHEISIGFEYLS
jgi:hypothetical protein